MLSGASAPGIARAHRRRNHAKSLLLLALGTSWAGGALAWDAEAHASIVLGAFRLSPAAESRVPIPYRDEFMKAVQEGSSEDVDCMQHRGQTARREASAEAERIYGELMAPGPNASPYSRANAIGRFLHFVADNAVPNLLARGQAIAVRDFFANKDFIVFRDRVPLSGRLGEALRRAGAEAQWGDDAETGQAAIYRLAVNLTIDALLLLPPVRSANSPEPTVPVVFVVNRIDNGFSTTRSQYYSSTSYMYAGPMIFESHSFGESRVGGDGTAKPDLIHRRGVQIVEWQRENVRESQNVHVLLYNNHDTCAASIAIKAGGWNLTLPGIEIPPRGVRKATLLAPAGVVSDAAFATSKPGNCSWTANAEGSIPTDYRLVLGMNGKPPRFEGEPERYVERPAPAKPRAVVR